MTCIKRKSFRGPSLWWWRAVSLRPRGSHVLLALPCSGDQIVGATIYFDNLQSGEVTQLLNTMGHHTVGLKLHRKGDRSPEPGQTWTHEVFSSRSSEVVLNTSQPPAVECKDQNKPEETISCVGALSVSTPNADGWQEAFCSSIFRTRLPGPPSPGAKTRWLKQQSLIFSQFWRPDVQGQGLGRADVLRPVSSAYGDYLHLVFPL
uniref:Uncharacterized protein n=1 Tax=Ursus maritimus TaxID=29073 RepID=A0A452U8C2_URSMA